MLLTKSTFVEVEFRVTTHILVLLIAPGKAVLIHIDSSIKRDIASGEGGSNPVFYHINLYFRVSELNIMYLEREHRTLASPEKSSYDSQPEVSTANTFYWLFRALTVLFNTQRS